MAIDKKRNMLPDIRVADVICSRLASELSTDIAAAGIVGGLYFPMKSPPRAVSVIAFHGTEDKNVRFEHGKCCAPLGGK